jgi:hypothetical protein
MHGPTGTLLVGATFVCLCLMTTVLAVDYKPNVPEALSEVMAYHSHFVLHSLTSDLGTLQVSGGDLTFPWAKRLPLASKLCSTDLMCRSPPTKEEIILAGSDPVGQVEDLGAMNCNIQNIEKFVDAKLRFFSSDDLRRASVESSTSKQRLENNLDIDVSGISVRAINTVPGGKAVATSNIVIKPVQIIVCSHEIEEKLK